MSEELNVIIESIKEEFDAKLRQTVKALEEKFEVRVRDIERRSMIATLSNTGKVLADAAVALINTSNDMYRFEVRKVQDSHDINGNTIYAQRQGTSWVLSKLMDDKMKVFDINELLGSTKKTVEEYLANYEGEEDEIALNIYRF